MIDYIDEIKRAYNRIQKYCKNTPLIYSTTFSLMSKNDLYLKLENFQKTGSFKIRGAINKILKLDKEDIKNGVITASAGNHGQAVALAATLAGIKSHVVVPNGTPINKIIAIEGYGAKVTIYGNNYDEAYNKAIELKEKYNYTFIHAYDDWDIIFGQGTIGLEILKQCPGVEVIIVPIGGGGLISGIASYCKNINLEIKIIGVQTDNFCSMYNSFKKGKLEVSQHKGLTIADGIAVKKPGTLTFDLIKKYVDDIVLCNDDQIARAILLLMERAKIVSEGAGAASLAAILNNDICKDKKVVCLISGGNIDVNLLNRIIIRGLKESGRLLKFSTKLIDAPGSLLQVLEILKDNDANIISIDHNRSKLNIPFKEAEVIIEIETKNKDHINKILNSLSDYHVKILD